MELKPKTTGTAFGRPHNDSRRLLRLTLAGAVCAGLTLGLAATPAISHATVRPSVTEAPASVVDTPNPSPSDDFIPADQLPKESIVTVSPGAPANLDQSGAGAATTPATDPSAGGQPNPGSVPTASNNATASPNLVDNTPAPAATSTPAASPVASDQNGSAPAANATTPGAAPATSADPASSLASDTASASATAPESPAASSAATPGTSTSANATVAPTPVASSVDTQQLKNVQDENQKLEQERTSANQGVPLWTIAGILLGILVATVAVWLFVIRPRNRRRDEDDLDTMAAATSLGFDARMAPSQNNTKSTVNAPTTATTAVPKVSSDFATQTITAVEQSVPVANTATSATTVIPVNANANANATITMPAFTEARTTTASSTVSFDALISSASYEEDSESALQRLQQERAERSATSDSGVRETIVSSSSATSATTPEGAEITTDADGNIIPGRRGRRATQQNFDE